MTVAEKVVRIALAFDEGTKTLRELVSESGYANGRDTVSLVSVSEVLEADRSLIDTWLHYSEDKQTSSGWYNKKTKDQRGFEVGYYPAGPKLSFDDPVRACAEFVIREVEAIAQFSGV